MATKPKNSKGEVGYCRPPVKHRFVRGQSGNPKGRPRGVKNLATIIRQLLNAKITVRENGRARTITAREGLIAQLVREALRGNLRAIELMFKIPLLQNELADLRKSSPMSLEAWQKIAVLVRGELNPESGADETPVATENSEGIGKAWWFAMARRTVAGMLIFVSTFCSWLAWRFRSRAVLELEVIALRHQLAVLRRQRPGRTRLFSVDRFIWVWLYRVWPRCLNVIVLVKPATVVQWHRRGFRLYWRWRSKSGRPSLDREARDLIRQMSGDNPLWGAPRIHGELLKLGVEVSQATVAKYMVRRVGTPSPTWRTFLRNQASGIAAIDMFVVASASFRLLYVVILLTHDRRKIVQCNVTQHPTAVWLSRQVTEAFPWDTAPRFLLRDRDASYGSVFRKRVEVMGITEVVTAPRSPWQNGYVERVVGSIRRECLDYVVIFNERHLRRVLCSYLYYYNRSRTHLSLEKDCPDSRPVQPPARGNVIALPQVGGLHHRYERLAA